MKLYALSDLHLCLGVPEKTMEIFGAPWIGYLKKIQEAWLSTISDEDWVLLPGDLSWGMNLQEAKKDFAFIGDLPGNKIIIRGNHDYWSSATTNKLLSILPKNIVYLKGGVFRIPETKTDVIGTRLWDHSSIKIPFSVFRSPKEKKELSADQRLRGEKIFQREYLRLAESCKKIPPDNQRTVVMTHYPPISFDGSPGPVSELLQTYHVDVCVFGHLHGLKASFPETFSGSSVLYKLVAADYVNFCPQQILID
ncbi:metallophosphoesterase [Chlamydiifrater phoenicopteri]|uniref:metallophosphoesterase n=1 Tax=Chlamydiifrater phoenicopteri TaxID=2681469 RepID=UPI001BCD3166|nr:metallophosphoesterase [Chlamydiifrater phoenicopteri]